MVVGGGLGVPGAGAVALHGVGDAWTAVPIDRPETLWWVFGQPGPALDVWMVGEQGLAAHWDGLTVTTLPAVTTATLFGVWGASPDDVWFVGGVPNSATPDDVVLHWDGQSLTAATGIPTRNAALFKVWGAAANDVWIVGEHGTILHYDGQVWTDDSPPAAAATNLLTVHGCAANDVYAVGGQKLWHRDDGGWTQLAEPPLQAGANGVACGASGVLIVGNGGLKWRFDRATSTWHDEQLQTPWNTDFHGALVGSDGRDLAVGGSFNAPASAGPRIGVIGRYDGCP
jgi:hypothetical protein